MELLNLVNAKAVLMKKLVAGDKADVGDAEAEIQRVTDMIKRKTPTDTTFKPVKYLFSSILSHSVILLWLRENLKSVNICFYENYYNL